MVSYNGHMTLLESHQVALNEMQRCSAGLEETAVETQQDSPAILILAPVTPLSKAQLLVYPSSSLALSVTPHCFSVKDPNIHWNSD